MRSVEHPYAAQDLISVIVIAIGLRVMTWIVFRFAGFSLSRVTLFQNCFRITFHVGKRACYFTYFIRFGKNFGEGSREIPDVFHHSPANKSDCTTVSGDFGGVALFRVQNWPLVFTLPSCGIQIIVFDAHFQIRFPFLWRDSYIG